MFLDGFTGFTGQEWAILKRILAQAALVTVTLCADSLDEQGGSGLFAPVAETGRRLIGLAKEQGSQVAVPVTLTKPLRYQSGALAKVERELFRFTPGEEAQEEDALWLFEAANPQEEAQFVARTARYLARVKGYRYRQMAVIARTAQPYEDVLEAAFLQNEVPLFLDRREQIDAKPLTAAVLTALEAVSGNFETDALLRYAKTGFAGLTLDEISQLENYVLLWGIDRRRWLSDWQGNPQGFAEQFSDGARESLSEINRSRAHLVEPLLHLEQAAQDADGEGMAKAVYGLLEVNGGLPISSKAWLPFCGGEGAKPAGRRTGGLVGSFDDHSRPGGSHPQGTAFRCGGSSIPCAWFSPLVTWAHSQGSTKCSLAQPTGCGPMSPK